MGDLMRVVNNLVLALRRCSTPDHAGAHFISVAVGDSIHGLSVLQ